MHVQFARKSRAKRRRGALAAGQSMKCRTAIAILRHSLQGNTGMIHQSPEIQAIRNGESPLRQMADGESSEI